MNFNFAKYLQEIAESGDLKRIPSEKKKELKVVFGNFTAKISEKKEEGEENPRWILEVNDANENLQELAIDDHNKNNGYPDICRLYYTIKEIPIEGMSH